MNKFDRLDASINRGGAAIRQTRESTINSLASHSSQRGMEMVAIGQIKGRLGRPTRLPTLNHALELAISIANSKLFQNLGIDTEYRLIFGGHRFLALKILSIADPLERCRYLIHQIQEGSVVASPSELSEMRQLVDLPEGERSARLEFLRAPNGAENEKDPRPFVTSTIASLPPKNDPIPVLLFDPASEEERTSIEVLENQVRFAYSKEQIKQIALGLIEKGYRFGNRGKPTAEEAKVPAHQRQLIPALIQLVRLSKTTIQKAVAELQETKSPEVQPEVAKKPPFRQLAKVLKSFDAGDDAELEAWLKSGLELLESRGV